MHISVVQVNQQIFFSELPTFAPKRKHSTLLECFEGSKWNSSHFNVPFSYKTRVLEGGKFVTRAASSAPLSGSGADFPEQLFGQRQKQTTKKIAGIDQEEIEDPTLIADPDSCFCEFNGVQFHHKICDAELLNSDTLLSSSKPHDNTNRFSFPMILLHGFGASTFSWDRVMKPLARVSGSKVLAFDRPAFGLTSRANVVNHSSRNQETKPLNPYSMAFSVLATLHFIGFLATEKAILVGHSAGALVAVDAYFEAPERVAALILVAPAIFAPFMQNSQKESKSEGDSSGAKTGLNPFLRFVNILSKFSTFVAKVIARVVRGMSDMINTVYKKAISAILRSTIGLMVIRMIIDKFGTTGVRTAWYDASQVSDHVLQGYTKPLKVKGWDKALVEYTLAMLTDSSSKLKPPLGKRLKDISCPVLIVTGDTDRLVPSWNAERLSRAIPGSHFELIKNCGHLPQEEKAEEFVLIIDKFLQRAFGTAEEPQLQTVA